MPNLAFLSDRPREICAALQFSIGDPFLFKVHLQSVERRILCQMCGTIYLSNELFCEQNDSVTVLSKIPFWKQFVIVFKTNFFFLWAIVIITLKSWLWSVSSRGQSWKQFHNIWMCQVVKSLWVSVPLNHPCVMPSGSETGLVLVPSHNALLLSCLFSFGGIRYQQIDIILRLLGP